MFTHTEEVIRNAYNIGKNLTDIAKLLGYTGKGGNSLKSVKAKLIKLGLDPKIKSGKRPNANGTRKEDLVNKEKSRELRNQGLSYKEIAKKLTISASSAFTYSKDIVLTEAASKRLSETIATKRSLARSKGNAVYSQKMANIRENHANIGYELAKHDSIFRVICALYWGEGSKTERSSFGLSNTDPDMLKLTATWLDVNKYNWTFRCNYHPNNGLSEQQIIEKWREKIPNLSEDRLRKFSIAKFTDTHGNKKGKQPLGTALISVHSTELRQKVQGGMNYLRSEEFLNTLKL